MFKALVLDQVDGKTQAEIRELDESALPDGEVLVDVDYSSLNYKDGLAVTGKGKIISSFPAVPGIDFVGRVSSSADERFAPGDEVILTGWGVGERHWGGMAEKARVKADWLVPLPDGMSGRTAMLIGTAGLTAMLCVMALEQGGVSPEQGPVLVTGASGGVGSVAVALLAKKGFDVVAATGRTSEEAYLRKLGAKEIRSRDEMAAPPRPLEKQLWAGVVDTVGGTVLARALAETHYSGTVAACGLAGSHELPVTVMPFILRNVRLQGVDSVNCPTPVRQQAWQNLLSDLDLDLLGDVGQEIALDEVPDYAERILRGEVRGRTLIKL
ncbi:MDR family oxidoreductase [Marinobacterium mangrovicola]|uniref:Acrylyl-CoA reductase (NADPH) n=1 Tax=Marinobacterium mangrovicola TaxID=1476959 RepID=A0A4V2PE09_9GAMM|nr:MDR family oxidoreductase [Marinobacterium mangrovicola]TCK07326.1 acrylyl-CoA reductase (NADPH) [Marinobacterium mangrovicola]